MTTNNAESSITALQLIRAAGGNGSEWAIWAQKMAAWGLEPGKWPSPPFDAPGARVVPALPWKSESKFMEYVSGPYRVVSLSDGRWNAVYEVQNGESTTVHVLGTRLRQQEAKFLCEDHNRSLAGREVANARRHGYGYSVPASMMGISPPKSALLRALDTFIADERKHGQDSEIASFAFGMLVHEYEKVKNGGVA